MINKYTGQNLLVGGDFNTCLNVKYDKKGGRAVENESSYTKTYIRQFSRREQSRAGFVQSRIDFWLISVALEYQIGLSTLKPGNNSDHSIISITLELSNTQKRGKGFWKFNNELLKDQTYIAMIKTIIKDIKENVTMENKCQLWDFVKCRIRGETISYSIKRSRLSKKKENEVLQILTVLEGELASDSETVNLDDYHKAKYE